MGKKIRIAIVDDHAIVIDGINALLHNHPDIEIVLKNTNPVLLLADLKHHNITVLLTDVMMPQMSGQELAKKVKQQFPQIKILALSMSGQGQVVNEMINDADISGYVLKNIGKKELIEAIQKIASGGIYFSEEVLAELQVYNNQKTATPIQSLTEREKEIVRLIEKEFSNKTIAEKLFISERTVETHRKNIFRKTGATSLIGLIKYAYEHKIIER